MPYFPPPCSEVQAQETVLGPHTPCQAAPGAPVVGEGAEQRVSVPEVCSPNL